MNAREIVEHNRITGTLTRKRRALESLHCKHQYRANSGQDATGQHRRMAQRYAAELRAIGVPA